MALVNRLIDSDGSDATSNNRRDGLDLLRKGPLAIGLDDLSLDMGPAKLHATGSVQVASASPDDITGQAAIEVAGLDALIQQTSAVPMAAQAAPVLIFLKGIGKQDRRHGSSGTSPMPARRCS